MLAMLSLAGFFAACAQPDSPSVCRDFFVALDVVPHTILSLKAGDLVSIWDGDTYEGCEVQFETNGSLRARTPVPDFMATEETAMYHLGWRMSPGIGADGAGSGVFGIERGSTQCYVSWAQPSYIDDDGTISYADTYRMSVQCR